MYKYICGIVGYPLKNPRSVPLWKSFFKKNKIKSKMKIFNIKPSSINNFVKEIKKDEKFLATAISMPYKILMVKHADELDKYAKNAKSINLLVKKNNSFCGYNTDIFGAMHSIRKYISRYDNITIIGFGGTGEALFNYLYSNYPKKNFSIITSKYKSKNKKRVKKYKKLDSSLLIKKKLLINCTPLGSNLKKSYIKKSSISNELFKSVNKSSMIFDVVYSPKKTIMQKLAKKNKVKYINGLQMNTSQAKQALKIVFK
tara:strand:+ start:233 stop:1003 length:771 start_codon:yes stop_codon:yes gene_type:complete